MTSRGSASECLIFSTVKSSVLTSAQITRSVEFILKKLRVIGSLSIHCIGDTRMRTLNFRYRGKNSTTDVLTFRLPEGEALFGNTRELGDIFISVPQIIRQARGLRISPREEFIRMLIHGILHIIGYDHVTKRDAQDMFRIQEQLLKQLV